MAGESKIAIVATSHGVMGDTGERTGVWLEELTTPYYELRDAGYAVDVYSIAGGAIPVDPRSRKAAGENEPSVERYLADPAAQAAFEKTPAVEALDPDAYRAVFLPGGHGTMWDYPGNAALSRVLRSALEGGKVVAAVCHGPAAFVDAAGSDNRLLVAGRKVAAFTDAEEAAVGLTEAVPFLLESRLREVGADVRSAPDFEPFAVRDGNLVTGQNPASAAPVARLVIEALAEGADSSAAAE